MKCQKNQRSEFFHFYVVSIYVMKPLLFKTLAKPLETTPLRTGIEKQMLSIESAGNMLRGLFPEKFSGCSLREPPCICDAALETDC